MFAFERKPDSRSTQAREGHSAPHTRTQAHRVLQMASGPGASGVQFDFSRVPIYPPGGQIHAAWLGLSGPSTPLPHLDRIQESFGRHSVANVQAHSGATARAASNAIGANGFTTAGHVVFATPPNLRLAAHEAAHIVQQRAGLNLEGGFGRIDDRHERHADAVADRVMRGESSEALLDQYAAAKGATGVIVQKDEPKLPANARKGEVRLKDEGENIRTEEIKKLGLRIHLSTPFLSSIRQIRSGHARCTRWCRTPMEQQASKWDPLKRSLRRGRTHCRR